MKCLLILLLVFGVLFFGGCSLLLFYFELVVQIILVCVGLEYCDVILIIVDGVCLCVWWLLVKKGVLVKGIVFYLYGNGGNLFWYFGGMWWLFVEGYQVLMFDYCGYGQLEGQLGLLEVYCDIDVVFVWFDQVLEVKGIECVLLGQSFGGVLVIYYLVEYLQCQGQFKVLVFDGVLVSYCGIVWYMLDGFWLIWLLQVLLFWLVFDDDRVIYLVVWFFGVFMLFFYSIDDIIVFFENGIVLYCQVWLLKVL